MERYTKRQDDGWAVMDCQICPVSWMNKTGSSCSALYCRNRLKDRVADYEDTGLEPKEIERIVDEYGHCHTLRTSSAERLEIIREIPTERLRELVEAEREHRCVVLPKDGMVYYIEEAGGEKWVANKPIQQITVKFGWGLASLEFSLLDTGKYFTREAAEAALKGEQNGKR